MIKDSKSCEGAEVLHRANDGTKQEDMMPISSFFCAPADRSQRTLASIVMTSSTALALMIIRLPADVAESVANEAWIRNKSIADARETSSHPVVNAARSGGCPSGMPSAGPYQCLEVVKDGSGHGVMIRYGQSGASGFGFLHMLIDHNLDLGAVRHAIQQAAHGVKQPNGRYLYGQFHVGPGGKIDQYVNVFEERGPAAKGPTRK